MTGSSIGGSIWTSEWPTGQKLTLAEIGNCRLVWDPRQIAATTSKTIRLASVFSGTESDHAVHSVTSLPLFRPLRTEEMKSRSTLTLTLTLAD